MNKLPRIRQSDPIVDDKGRPTAAFTTLINNNYADKIETGSGDISGLTSTVSSLQTTVAGHTVDLSFRLRFDAAQSLTAPQKVQGNANLGSGGLATTNTWALKQTFTVAPTAPSYEVSATKVIGARKTGWAVATGTATRTTFATYAGQTVSNPPTQAEVQAIDNHVKVLSERLKALIDDLHATAGHGLIGP